MDDYVQLPLTASALRKWLRFSDKGGIGKALATTDKLAESGTDELMFMDGDELVVLMQLGNGKYLGSCEGVVGSFNEQDVRFITKLKKPVFTKKVVPVTVVSPDLEPSTTNDTDDILSSYASDALSVNGAFSPVSSTTASTTSNLSPARLLAPLDIRKASAMQSENNNGIQETLSPLSHQFRHQTSPQILPNLPAGVSLKQLRERSSPRYPLSPRSVSLNNVNNSHNGATASPYSIHASSTFVSPTQHHQRSYASPSSVIAPSHQQNRLPESPASYTSQPYSPHWQEPSRVDSPLLSPVPSSSTSPQTRRFPSSPARLHTDTPQTPSNDLYGSLHNNHMSALPPPHAHASSSRSPLIFSSSNSHPSPPSPPSAKDNFSMADLASETQSLRSTTGSFARLSQSRSFSSLHRAGSLLSKRRPSLPTINRSNSTPTTTSTNDPDADGIVQLNNTEFQFIEPPLLLHSSSPSSSSTLSSSFHSTTTSAVTTKRQSLITRPSATAKERIRSIYVADLLPELDHIVDEFGFMHSRHAALPSGDVSRSKDTGSMEAYRARELKWVSIMGSMPPKSARSANKVRKLVSFGIPNSVRGKAWTYLSEATIRRQEGLYHDLCMREDLPESDQIDDDVSFCFQDHAHFCDDDSIGRADLQSVLKAILHYMQNLEYERGLCYLAGLLLLHVEAESAFWLLAAIVRDYLPGYYTKGRQGSLRDARILKYILEKGEPELVRHVHNQGLNLETILSSWLSAIFVRTLPWASQLRVMDLFLYGERPSQLGLRVGLAIMDLLRDAILEKRSGLAGFLQAPPPEFLAPSLLVPSLLTIRIPARTLKKAIKLAQNA